MKAVKRFNGSYELMYFMGILAFRTDAQMPLIRALVAFYYIEELRQVALPQVPEYASFKPSELPQKEALRKLAANFKISPPEVGAPYCATKCCRTLTLT